MLHWPRRRATRVPLNAMTSASDSACLAPPQRRAARRGRPGRVLLACAAWALAAPSVAAAKEPEAVPPLGAPTSQPPGVVTDWLGKYTAIDSASVVSVGDEYIVAVLSSRPVDPATPRLLRLEIRAEMTDPDSPTAGLLRSLSATLDVNCADHTSHFVEVRTFAGPNLTGAEQISHPTEGWVVDPHGSYFEDVDAAVCRPDTPRPLAAARSGGRQAGRERTLSTPLRRSQAADAPRRNAMSHATPGGRGGGQAQIVAAPSQAKAEAALAELRTALPDAMSGLSSRIERIERNGVAYYRALVSGFTPPATAASFCRQIAAAGHACIAR